jgi:serine/threonine-protein kinase
VGALGPVFRTYEPTRDRLVAVKAFRLDITPEQGQALADELSHAAEAELFHPSIVEPIAAGVQGMVAYRAEEYVAAESLDVALRQFAPASFETMIRIVGQLAEGIDVARRAGVGHGALHPRDIFVTPDDARWSEWVCARPCGAPTAHQSVSRAPGGPPPLTCSRSAPLHSSC